jgi:hypothetical protein
MKAILLAGLILAPMPAFAQTTPAPSKAAGTAPITKCEKLARQWRGIEFSMAERNVAEISDNSAPRATLRAMEEANDLARAGMILQFMKDNRCTGLPSSPPSYLTYLLGALNCSTARLKGTRDAPECNYETWTRTGD